MFPADPPYQRLVVEKIEEQIPGFKTFQFAWAHSIHWKAGQYLTIVKEVAGDELRRSYSITSSPALNEPLAIGVRRMENGLFSRWLTDVIRVGDTLTTMGAGGFFTLPENIEEYRQVFFFAAGSGITPVYSLLKTLLHRHPSLSIVLVYSNASREKTIFFHELLELKQAFPRPIQIEFLFSNNPDLARARLNRDLLLEILEMHGIAAFGQTLYYTCGPESYMRMCTFILQELGVPKENIRRENFITHIPSVPVYPPDQRTHKAFIRYGSTSSVVDVHYPDSILKAAKKQGIKLPFSCEAGQCGNCAALCQAGKVWHSNNEVLTDKDLDNGWVLTCVGHPVGGDVYLEVIS